MRIFQIKNQVDGFATIDFADVDVMSVLKTGNMSVLEGKSFKWNRTVNSAKSDCPFFIGSQPIFLTSKLGNTLRNASVATSTFDVEGDQYTIVLPLNQIANALNVEKSKCRTFRSGKIMDVMSYVLNSQTVFPEIFYLNEFKMYAFCNEKVAKDILSCHFNQLILEECSQE